MCIRLRLLTSDSADGFVKSQSFRIINDCSGGGNLTDGQIYVCTKPSNLPTSSAGAYQVDDVSCVCFVFIFLRSV